MSASASGKLQFKFEDREGAVLHLHNTAYKQTLGRDSYLREYVAQHGRAMHGYVQGWLGLDLQMEELIFVTGTLKTAAWDSWTFTESSRGNSISFDVSVPNVAGASLEYERSFDDSSSPVYAWGPRELPPSPLPTSDAVSNRSRSTSSVGPPLERVVEPGDPPLTSNLWPSTSRLSTAGAPTVASPGLGSARTSQQTLNLPANQCLLVSGYKFKSRVRGFLRRILGAGAPRSDPPSSEGGDNEPPATFTSQSQTSSRGRSDSKTAKVSHLSDCILIARTKPYSHLRITHWMKC
jgi:hypothetical protein